MAVSFVVAAAAKPATELPAAKLAGEAKKLPTSTLKKWLDNLVSSKRKLKVDEKHGSPFKPTKAELVAYGISVAVLALSFSYVKVSTFADILVVLPTILATSILVGFAKAFASIVYARRRGVWTEHKLWYFGLGTFLVTTLAFRMPFSSPSRNVYHSAKMTKRLGATLSIFSILMALGFAGFFGLLLLGGLAVVGGTGLAMCLIDAFFDTFPIAPMNGRSVFDHSKKVWAGFFALTLCLYASWLLLA